jgi:hypothetical protein
MPSITKREDLPDLLFRRYRPIAKVITAIQLSEAEDILSSGAEGQLFHGEPEDWKIIYGANSDGSLVMAICDRDIFARIYDLVGAMSIGRNHPSSLRPHNSESRWIL